MTMKIKRIMFTLAASLGLLLPAAVPAIVSAQAINDQICNGAQLNPNANGCSSNDITSAGDNVGTVITNGINLFSLIVGIIAVIMIIIGGVKYITSGGDAGNVTGAKNTILYALIGLVIVALAQTIVYFVLNKTSNGLS